jgi:hypothetical protein
MHVDIIHSVVYRQTPIGGRQLYIVVSYAVGKNSRPVVGIDVESRYV